MIDADEVASAACIGAEEYAQLMAFWSNNEGHRSTYELRAPDGRYFRLTVEEIPEPRKRAE